MSTGLETDYYFYRFLLSRSKMGSYLRPNIAAAGHNNYAGDSDEQPLLPSEVNAIGAKEG